LSRQQVDAFELSAASPCVEAASCPRPPPRVSPATAAAAADTQEVQVEWAAQAAEEDDDSTGSLLCRVLGEEVMGPSPLSAAPPLALPSLAEETEEAPSPSPSRVELPIARRLLLSPAALPTPVASPPPPPQPGTWPSHRPLVVVKVHSIRLGTCPRSARSLSQVNSIFV